MRGLWKKGCALLYQAFKAHARKFLPQDILINLILDRRPSRKGVEWIEECRKFNMIAIINVGDTSRF